MDYDRPLPLQPGNPTHSGDTPLVPENTVNFPPQRHGSPEPIRPTPPPQINTAAGVPTNQPTNQPGSRGLSMLASSIDKLEDETLSGDVHHNDNQGLGLGHPLPPPPVRLAGDANGVHRSRTMDTHVSMARRSGIDWIVPVEEKPLRRHTVAERLQPTLDIAIAERDKYAMKAKATGYTLNIAIGLQVLLGSLTTGLSAVATTGKSAAVQTTILGGLATLVASYLARARGSNEPELSITRTKDLEHFIRECQSFQMDHGHEMGRDFDQGVERLRQKYEELLGNASGERKLSPPV